MAEHYQHILLAADLLPDNDCVAQRALQLARDYKARLSLVHVVENIPLYFGNELVLPETQEIEQRMIESARARLLVLAAQLGLEDDACHVEIGSPRAELLVFAQRNGVDLIVIGSHSRHGLGRLLGATANGVLHGAECDVMAVRIPA